MDYRSKYKGSEIEAKLDEVFKSHLQDKAVDITENGTTEVVADENYLGLGKVTVNVDVPSSGGGGSELESNDVNFYDYDGTILHSYTKNEFLAMSTLPPLPEREGLICQEWNYTLDEARECVNACGMCEVGAIYSTDNGDTRIYIDIKKEELRKVILSWNFVDRPNLTINWGDGSSDTITTYDRYCRHTYAQNGKYVITMSLGGARLKYKSCCHEDGTTNGNNMIVTKVEMGDFITGLDTNAFDTAINLEYISLSPSVQSFGYYAFRGANLKHINIPRACTEIGNSNLFASSYFLESASFPSSAGIIVDSSSYDQLKSIKRLIFPKSDKEWTYSAINYCTKLKDVVIRGVPSFKSMLTECKNLERVFFTDYTSVPILSSYIYFNLKYSIIVPDALYDEWIAATNWSSYASYIIKKSDWDAQNS